MTGNAAETVSGRVIGNIISPEQLERAKELQAAGFVHVTGLPTMNDSVWTGYVVQNTKFDLQHKYQLELGASEEPVRPQRGIIQAQRSALGCHDYNNGKTVVVTVEGEVWLKAGGGYYVGTVNNPLYSWCPNGGGAFVPCSNGEEVPMHLLLERFADPYADCNKNHSPIPEIRG